MAKTSSKSRRFLPLPKKEKSMNLTQVLASNVRGLFVGPNMTGVHLKEILDGIDQKSATQKIADLNTIAVLVFHIDYYLSGVLDVLRGGPLLIRDRFSYDCPPVETENDWQTMVEKIFTDAEAFAAEIEKMPESRLFEPFFDEKYGDYHKNLLGLLEHSHYHMGQISLLKKLVLASKKA